MESRPSTRALLGVYLRPQARPVCAMALLLVMAIALEVAEPQIVAAFIAEVQAGGVQSVLVTVAVVYLTVAVLRQVATVLATYASEQVSWTATNRMREDLVERTLELELAFHESRSSGELIERTDGDVNEVAEFFSSLIVQILGNVLLVLGILGALTVLDWRIGLTFVALVVVGYGLLHRIGVVATRSWGDDREQSAQFFGYVSELVRATEDLRSAGAVTHAMGRLYRRLREWLPVKVRAEAWGGAIWVCLSLIFTAGSAAAFGFGGVFFHGGSLSLPEVYMVVAYSVMISSPMETLRQHLQNLQQASAAVGRIAELLARRPALVEGDTALPPGAAELEFRDVTFHYGGSGTDRPALRDASFRLHAGERMGVVGRTGAGKSTIAKLIARLVDPTSGQVVVGGVDLRDATTGSLRSTIALVPQDVHVFDATVLENVTLFDPSIAPDRVLDAVHAMGLRPWLDALPDGLDSPITADTLSAGQAQVVALTRVFLRDPSLVVLDEPSSRLDLGTEATVERALDRLLAGRTVIVIAHRLETVRRTDRAVVVEDGRIVEQGATATLLARDGSRLAELFRAAGATT